MNLTKKVCFYFITAFFICLVSIIAAIGLFEVYCRIYPEKFHSYGWQKDNLTENIINQCEALYGDRMVTVVLGDSLVEFYGDREPNLVKQLEIKDKSHNYCNFGISGAGPKAYANRLAAVFDSKKLSVNRVIVFLYEGNDFSDYLLNNKYDPGTDDRKHSYLMSAVKGSFAINFIYRDIIKRFFYKGTIDPLTLARSVDLRDTDLKKAENIFQNTPVEIKSKLQANLLNVSWFSVALAMPNYFERVHSPTSVEFNLQKRLALDSIQDIVMSSKKNGAEVSFFIIPHDYFLFDDSKQRWHDTFRFEINPRLTGPSKLSRYLIGLDNTFYPENLFVSDDYIVDDGHLTYTGNEKLAGFVTRKIYGNK